MRRILRLLRNHGRVELIPSIHIFRINILRRLSIWLLEHSLNCQLAFVHNSSCYPTREERTGNCAWIDCNCGGDKTPEFARYSSSVLMVPSERLICAGSGMAGCVRACVRLCRSDKSPGKQRRRRRRRKKDSRLRRTECKEESKQ